MFEHAVYYLFDRPSPYTGLWFIFVAEAWLINRQVDSLLWCLIAIFWFLGLGILLAADWHNRSYLISDISLVAISVVYTLAMLDFPLLWLKDSLLALLLFGSYFIYKKYEAQYVH